MFKWKKASIVINYHISETELYSKHILFISPNQLNVQRRKRGKNVYNILTFQKHQLDKQHHAKQAQQ